MARRPGARAAYGEEFSFVSPLVKYLLFFLNMLFWVTCMPLDSSSAPFALYQVEKQCLGGRVLAAGFVAGCNSRAVIAMLMMAVGVYARLMKHAAAFACLAVDPAILLIVVGVLMFLLTFCGCIGSLRENICLLQTFSICLTVVFLLQLAAGVLGFVFSDKARGKVSEIINNAIVHYRDDLDLQNLIDFGQKKFSCCGGISYRDWSLNMYFNCSDDNPSRERCSVPYSCCLPTPNQAVINTMCGQGMQEREYLEASEVIYTNGCIDKLVNWIHSNLFLLGGVALGLAIPQLVGILLSQILVNQIKDQIRLQLYNQQHRADPWH
ncbi:tetraspanin-33 isoform X2 [Dasypus novemcinctus]|uniref:tetraspanin-33 isoform X2 n=1 Tax=Dasypus novemcinctus TaxID=9361 RepID=UPI000C81FB2C|nr:tetraspanin-33 isoform X2 [Dasypus novemcinctus]